MSNEINGAVAHAVLDLMHTFERVKRLHKRLHKEGIPRLHWFIMMIVMTRDSISMSELSVLTETSRQQLTAIIDKLVALNYVERLNDDSDRRIVKIQIKKEGKNIMRDMESMALESIADYMARLSYDDKQKFIKYTGEIIVILNKIYDN